MVDPAAFLPPQFAREVVIGAGSLSQNRVGSEKLGTATISANATL
jgi:hypothetical protein